MKQWHLTRAGTQNQIRFQYACCDIGLSLGLCVEKETELDEDGGGNSIYLDRHNLQCGDNEVMKQWHLTKAGTQNQIRFQYACCDVGPSLGLCVEKETELNED